MSATTSRVRCFGKQWFIEGYDRKIAVIWNQYTALVWNNACTSLVKYNKLRPVQLKPLCHYTLSVIRGDRSKARILTNCWGLNGDNNPHKSVSVLNPTSLIELELCKWRIQVCLTISCTLTISPVLAQSLLRRSSVNLTRTVLSLAKTKGEF
jgi:hypothetical protein